MSQNQEQQHGASPKKSFSFLSLVFTIIIVLVIIIGCYYAFFPNKKEEITFITKELENKINTYIENPGKIFEGEKSPSAPQDMTEDSRSSFDKAAEIIQKITSPTETPDTAKKQNPEDNLAEHDMAQKQDSGQKASANTSESFNLEPPSSMPPLEGGRRMLTEEEIAEAQAKDQQAKLAKLNELRSEQSTAIYDTDNVLPTKEGALSPLTPDTSLDPVVTLFFVHDLAEYLVNNYRTAESTAVTMPRLNQRYGTGLTGLEHSKGRAGVLEYAYNASMIPLLYKHLSPELIKAMQIAAEKKNMPPTEQKKMFKTYANLCSSYADAIRTLIDVPQLAENIQNLNAIESDLKKEENLFAENLLGFEQNRENSAVAKSYEEKVRQNTIRSAQLKTRVNAVKNQLRQYLIQYDKKLADIPNCLELALWLNRRNNASASAAFASALDSFAVDVSELSHE